MAAAVSGKISDDPGGSNPHKALARWGAVGRAGSSPADLHLTFNVILGSSMNYALPAKLRVFGDGSASARSVPHRSCKDDTLAVFLADILMGIS